MTPVVARSGSRSAHSTGVCSPIRARSRVTPPCLLVVAERVRVCCSPSTQEAEVGTTKKVPSWSRPCRANYSAGSTTEFIWSVTAVCARSLPLIDALVFMAIIVLDRIVPSKCACVPMATAPAVCQKHVLGLCATGQGHILG